MSGVPQYFKPDAITRRSVRNQRGEGRGKEGGEKGRTKFAGQTRGANASMKEIGCSANLKGIWLSDANKYPIKEPHLAEYPKREAERERGR